MAADPKLTLNNWWLGMSLSDYTWGSYFFSKGILWEEKSFKLDKFLAEERINSRTNWDIIAQLPDKLHDYQILFTKDWYIETDAYQNEQAWVNWWGFLSFSNWLPFWPLRKSSDAYVNTVRCWDSIVWIKEDNIDKVTFWSGSWLWVLWPQTVANPTLTTDTSWTINSGWATWTSWCTHTSWGWVSTIIQDITTAWTWNLKISFLITGWTTGKVACFYNSTSLWLIEVARNWLFNTFIDTATWWVATFGFIPTDDFDWTVTFCEARELDWLEIDKTSITSATSHPAYYDSPFLYIGSGSSIDMIDTTTYVNETLNIIEWWFDIVAINRLWDKILIRATDGYDSKQYYWDWTSSEVLEIVDWKNKEITNVVIDWNRAYVLVENWYKKYIYLANGYDKELLVSNTQETDFSDYMTYNKKFCDKYTKFNFTNINTNSLIAYEDSIAVAWVNGVYTYGKEKSIEEDHWGFIKTTKNSTANSQTIDSLWYKEDKLMMSFKTQYGGTTFNTLATRSILNNERDWYLITIPMLRDNFSSRKNLDKLKIGYVPLTTTKWNIKIHVSCDDNYFWNAYVTWVTVTPSIWDTYTIWTTSLTWEVIATDITTWTWTITLKTIEAIQIRPTEVWYSGNIKKVTWDWDASITYNDMDNFALVKEITSDNQIAENDLIFSTKFINAHMPKRHKIQLKIELHSSSSLLTPVVYDISLMSDIVDSI